uniref:Predicted protein n=1 Tax=Hordeum vulgare subsp. vulgare TaxID=112509 RepID=F2DX77_HORVV|nr:predicted protein [Hordeum vulgare subsp. vulgare]
MHREATRRCGAKAWCGRRFERRGEPVDARCNECGGRSAWHLGASEAGEERQARRTGDRADGVVERGAVSRRGQSR